MYSPGPNWSDDTAKQQEIVKQHAAYQDGQFNGHSMLLGGPFIDRPGGLAVFQVKTKIQLDSILAADPAIIAGLYTVTIYPWYLAHRPTEEECGRFREDL